MRILHLGSWHPRLSYDQLRAFRKLGHEVFSTDFWADPRSPVLHKGRLGHPPLDWDVDPELLAEFRQLNPRHEPFGHVYVDEAFVRRFDLVVCVYCHPAPGILFDNWAALRCRPVIWNTYGQQYAESERKAARLKADGRLTLCRNSPRESFIVGYAGEDCVVRTLVDDEHFTGWVGGRNSVLTFENDYKHREMGSNTKVYKEAIRGLPARLCGYGSEDAPNYGGVLSPEDQLAAYREHDVYFGLGSKPATLTYNLVESMMVGAPTLTWGRRLGGLFSFEGPDLFTEGEHILYADSADEASRKLTEVLTSPGDYRQMGSRARVRARELFGWEANLRSWEEAICLALS